MPWSPASSPRVWIRAGQPACICSRIATALFSHKMRSHFWRALCATATDGRSQGVHPTPWNCTKSHKSHRQSGPTKKNRKVHIGHPRLHQVSCLPRKSHQQGGHAGTLRDEEACIRPPPCATKATKTKDSVGPACQELFVWVSDMSVFGSRVWWMVYVVLENNYRTFFPVVINVINAQRWIRLIYFLMWGKRRFKQISEEISIPSGTVKFLRKIIMVLSSGFNILWAKIVKQKIGLNLTNKKKKKYFNIKKEIWTKFYILL